MTQDSSFVYLKVPIKWKAIYRKLLKLMAKQGYSMLEDCNSSCTGKGKQIINCWNMFNAACAALDNGNEKLALNLIRTVIGDLNSKYNSNIDESEYLDMTFDESKYDKIIFSNLTLFTEFFKQYEEDVDNFKDFCIHFNLNTAEDIADKITYLLEGYADNYVLASIDEEYEPSVNKNILYFDDEDDLKFKTTINNYIFIINVPKKYKVKEIYYNEGDLKSIIESYISYTHKLNPSDENEITSYIYYNNDISEKEIIIELEKNE